VKKKMVMLAGALALASPWTGAQTVWRCGSSYSQQPCPGGAAVSTSDRPTPAESALASRLATDDARRADAMEKARLAQERNAPKAIVIGPQAPESVPVSTAKEGTKPKGGKLEQVTATAPRGPGEKKKEKGQEQKGKKQKAGEQKAGKGKSAKG
jgi:hypothetical protein